VLLLFLALNWIAESRWRVTAIAPGDSKLIAVAAVALPFWQFVVFIAAMALCATVFGLVAKARTGSRSLPLGPSFALALWICLLAPGLGDVLATSKAAFAAG
jgi:prepilin signal peptidase PulO-like enzyme (type II secretory pathway)